MQQSDLFAYLAAFISLVLAVALTDMIQSVHRLIRARERVKWDPLTPLFALSVFVGLLSSFFSLWGDARFDRLTFYGFMGLMAGPTVMTFAAFAVLPDDVPEGGIDLRQFYFDNRRYVVSLLALVSVSDIILTFRWAIDMNALGRADFWWHFAPVAVANTILLAVMYVSKNWRVQLASQVVAVVLAHFAFGGWYIDALPDK